MTQFRALANLIGSYSQNNDGQGIFTLTDGTEIEANFGRNLKPRFFLQPERLEEIIGVSMAWKLYPKTDKMGKLSSVLLNGYHTEISQHWNPENYAVVRGIIVPTESSSQTIAVEIRPGRRNNRQRKPKPFRITITGDRLPIVEAKQWWSFKLDLVDGYLRYNQGRCLGNLNASSTIYGDNQQSKITRRQIERPKLRNDVLERSEIEAITDLSSGIVKDSSIVPRLESCQSDANSLTVAEEQGLELSLSTKINFNSPISEPEFISEAISITGRVPELTIKFDTRPELPETGKKVTLNITSDNGIKFRATLNRKTLKKQVEKMDSFEQWVGALSGKMSAIDSEGVIELLNAGLTVFEKKLKSTAQNKEQSIAEDKIAS